MPEWYVYDKKGKKRKARPEEIPKPLGSGVDPEDGCPINTKKRGDASA